MLILTRKPGEQIQIGDNITVEICAVKGNQVRIGISAPPSVTVDRLEIHERKQAEALAARVPPQHNIARGR